MILVVLCNSHAPYNGLPLAFWQTVFRTFSKKITVCFQCGSENWPCACNTLHRNMVDKTRMICSKRTNISLRKWTTKCYPSFVTLRQWYIIIWYKVVDVIVMFCNKQFERSSEGRMSTVCIRKYIISGNMKNIIDTQNMSKKSELKK